MSRLSPRAAAWGYTALVAVVAAWFLADIPVQLSDSLQNLIGVSHRTLRELFVNNLWAGGYMRPLLFAPIRLVYLASDGHYSAWFRATHAVQLMLVLAAVAAALRVRTWSDALALPLALSVALAIHTSADTIREAFPVNAYLTVVLLTVLAVVISRGTHRWWSDAAAVLTLAVASLSVESGLLVGVVFVAGAVAGWRGVSRGGVAAVVLGVLAYLGARYLIFHVGTPGLNERATGFGLEILEPKAVQARFGANPWPLYVYNVAASVGSVLFAEPRAGVFWVLRAMRRHDLEPWMFVNVAACTALTVLLAVHVYRGRARWRRWALTDADRMIAVFVAVLGANAAMNFVYTKDVIMSPAGVLFALAAAGALAALIEETRETRVPLAAVALVGVIAVTWGIKTLGVHYSLRDSAHMTRKTWVSAPRWLESQQIDLSNPRDRAVADTLRADALWRRHAAPRIQIHWRWPGNWFDTTQ